MKSWMILMLVVMSMLLPACGSGVETPAVDDTPGVAGSSDQQAPTETAIEPEPPDGGDQGQDTGTGGQDQSSLVVKSGNAVTDADKQAVLDELDMEVDRLLDSLEQLDEPEESDLIFD